MPFASSMRRVEVTGPRARHLGRDVGQGLEPEGVGEPARRIHGDHAGPPSVAGRLEGDRRRHRRLADPARAAAHHYVAACGQVVQVRCSISVGHVDDSSGARAPTSAASERDSTSSSSGPIEGVSSAGTRELGEGQLTGESLELLGLECRALEAEPSCRLERRPIGSGCNGHLLPVPPHSRESAARASVRSGR